MDNDDRIYNSLNKIENRLDSMDKTLVKHEANLKEHMRRSDNSEKALAMIATELKPVKQHIVIMQFLGKIAMWFGGSSLLIFLMEKLLR